MPISSRSYVNRYTPSNRFPVGVKWLLIVNVVIFLLYKLVSPVRPYLDEMALVPALALFGLRFWQVLPYMFLHIGVMNAVWNMLTIWLFGAELERTWGTQKFIRYYVSCGVIAGLAVILVTYAFGSPGSMIVSANGAIYGILAAYAVVFPDNTLLFGFLIPIPLIGGIGKRTAIVALVIGVAAALVGRFVKDVAFLYDYAWFVGFFLAGGLYYLMMLGHRIPRVQEVEG